MPMTLNMGGFDEKLARMMRSDGLRRGIRAGALYLRGKVGTYPPVSRRKVGQYLTAKQIRFLHAASKSGDIEIPYRRGASPGSERMGLRWELKATNGGLTQTIGNNSSYINYVQGDDQSVYHRLTGWEKVEDIVDDEEEEVFNIINREMQREVSS